MVGPRFDVVGVGINSVDRVAVLPGFPQASGAMSKMRLVDYQTRCGGQTATALVACCRMGLTAAYVGAVGDDEEGAIVLTALGAAGVDTSAVAARHAATRFALVLIDETTGQRAVLWQFDERLKLTDEELPPALIGRARLVHVDDVDEEAAIAAARIAVSRGVPVTSDIDHVTERTPALLDAVTVAMFAEEVPQQLASRVGEKRTGPFPALAGGPEKGPVPLFAREVCDALAALPRRPDQALVVTLGDRGAVALDDRGFHYHAGYRVQPRDTTGAGDVFRAGFIYALLHGRSMDERLRYGNAAAAISCTRLGAMASAPTLHDIQHILTSG